MLTRVEMKQRAREAMASATTHPILVGLIFTLLNSAIAFVLPFIMGMIMTAAGIGASITDPENAELSSVLLALPITALFSLIIGVLTSILMVGFFTYTLKTIRHQQAGIGTLFSYFSHFVKIFGLTFMISLFTTLWSLLFIIPGYIAMLRYSQAFMIFIDDPDKGIMQCINESKAMMSGHLWEYFVLQISFILWELLSMVTCGIAMLYVQPYIYLTNSVYYDNLRYLTNPPQEDRNLDIPNIEVPIM
ncbi:MAG: DUF975 family protein [Lachnospiraceae bacterium]